MEPKSCSQIFTIFEEKYEEDKLSESDLQIEIKQYDELSGSRMPEF